MMPHGLSSSNQEKVKYNKWINGPEFLWKIKSKWPIQNPDNIDYTDSNDPELRKTVSVNVIKLKEDMMRIFQLEYQAGTKCPE